MNVVGTGSCVGGLLGYSGFIHKSSIMDSYIECNNVNTEYVGGMVGNIDQHTVDNDINNIEINSVASNIGVFAGGIGGTAYCRRLSIINSVAKGTENVGGIVGKQGASEISRTYAEVKLIGTNNIGGIVGKLENNNMTAANNTSYIFNNYIANSKLEGDNNVGGMVGHITSNLYMPDTFYHRNYVEADLSSADRNSISLGIGSRQNQNQYLSDTYYYKYSILNGENPNSKNEPFILQENYLTENDLKKQITYTSKLKWSTSSWDFTVLTNNKYPILQSSSLKEQTGIDIPKDSEHIVGNIENSVETQKIREQETLEQTFEYSDKTIETYNTYSVIISSDGSKATRNAKLYVKDNNLYVIPSTLGNSANSDEAIVPVANNLIVDNYNGKEYETVLGSDGKLYDLKEPIAYPENFINEGIESIGNNLENASHELEVTYKDGDRIKFNYQTGEVISSSKNEDTGKIGIFDYLKTKISEIGKSNSNVSKEITNKYEESKVLQNKLEEMPVEEVIEKQNLGKSEQTENVGDNFVNVDDVLTNEANNNNATNNSLQEQKYISIYNAEKDEYQVYKEEELLDTKKQEVISENDKIEANNLKEYYASEGEAKNTKMGIVWIALSIIGVVIILFAIKKRD